MTEFVHDAGVAVFDWLQRHVAPLFAIVFALGFTWAQFGAVEAAIVETRSELRDLRREFVAYRIAGGGATRDELEAAMARQRDIDLRQDATMRAMFNRMTPQGLVVAE